MTTVRPDIEELAAFAADLADAAGPIIRRYFRTGLSVDTKADESPVTIADRTVEKRLREMIEARWPDHGIAGEEFGLKAPDADYVWSLDPIDGTKAFITGRPTFGPLIGLLERRAPLLGVIDCPILGERWIGGPTRPTTLNGQPVTPMPPRTLAQATMAVTSPHMFDGWEMTAYERLRAEVNLTVYGGDCHNYGLVALGTIDLVVESNLQDYDYLAPAAVIAGAGGLVTDWDGNPVLLGSTTKVIAARTPELHAEALKQLQG
ncbi:Archaeal fructose-1,6-bisphosphatase and related enzyme of inositol monophosphatase family protein [alpha proteobacterium BAL199]|nr:Archaeal fructose-1,6-bisphosphatase and related enzyme of inositol monophosphatase family protein [alpha proteobacterium BAL199]